jgi:hypothetical protein
MSISVRKTCDNIESFVQGENVVLKLTFTDYDTKKPISWTNVTEVFSAHPLKSKAYLIKTLSEYAAVAEESTITAVADIAGSLNKKFIKLYDDVGSVAVWSDNNNAGQLPPVHGCDRAIKITTVDDGNTAEQNAASFHDGINADPKFSSAIDGDTFVVTDANPGKRTDGNAADSGFNFEVTKQGRDEGEVGGIQLPSGGDMTITIPIAESIELLADARTRLDVTIDFSEAQGGRTTYQIDEAYEITTRPYDLPLPA